MVERCLQLDPKRRYPSAQSIVDDLQRRQERTLLLRTTFRRGLALILLGLICGFIQQLLRVNRLFS
jgi:hypothetical protein